MASNLKVVSLAAETSYFMVIDTFKLYSCLRKQQLKQPQLIAHFVSWSLAARYDIDSVLFKIYDLFD